ncbi:excalibur calcium-binding domain-containing protein [Rhizobium laguerreae]|uniref:excalibur calcium-binding domain-containing protein n=1 Tax=Rhizobium laguerreae TaxID=1076926 RepID=UPI0035E403DE
MVIEAELATRGETSSGNEYVGRRTAATVGVPYYLRAATTSYDLDCARFQSSAEAQRFFLKAGGPAIDPNGLDRDGDGYACEFGQTLLGRGARPKSKPVSTARYSAPRQAQSQCFVGPRGGTYTITASGNKNYGGC